MKVKNVEKFIDEVNAYLSEQNSDWSVEDFSMKNAGVIRIMTSEGDFIRSIAVCDTAENTGRMICNCEKIAQVFFEKGKDWGRYELQKQLRHLIGVGEAYSVKDEEY